MTSQLPQSGRQTVGNCNNIVVVSSNQRHVAGVHATVIQPDQAQQLATLLAASQSGVARAVTSSVGASQSVNNVRLTYVVYMHYLFFAKDR